MTTPAWSTYDILEWGSIPGTYQRAQTCDVTPGTEGIVARLNYSGMAMIGTKLYLVRDGGHEDYPGNDGTIGGNEVVVVDVGADTPVWALDRAASTDVYTADGSPYFSDGSPKPAHNYWGSLPDPDGNVLQLYTSFTAGGESYPASNRYNTGSKTYAAAGTIADAPGRFTTVDTSTGCLWGTTADDLHCYDPSTNTYTTVHSPGVGITQPLTYDPVNDDFVAFGWGDGQASSTGTNFIKVSKTGTQTAVSVNSSASFTAWEAIEAIYHSVLKDPHNDRWFIFSPIGNAGTSGTIYTLTPGSGTTYDMGVLATTGETLPPCNVDGSMNRLQYVAALDSLVYMANAVDNVMSLRLGGTPAPGRTSPNPNLKFLSKLQDSLPTEEISGTTITKHGAAALDVSGEGFLLASSGDILTVASWPYFTPPFTMGVRLKQSSSSGDNIGLIGLNLDSDAKVFTLQLDNNHNAHAWSRGSAIGDAAQTVNGFTYDKWYTYAAVFHADGSRSVYDSTVGMVSNTDSIDMSGSAAELYIGSYPRSDTPWTASGLEAWVFFMTEEQTKGDLDLIAAQPDSLLVAALPDLTATVAVDLGGFSVAVAAADPDSTSIGFTLGGFSVAGTASVKSTAAVAVALSGFTVAATAGDPDSTSIGIVLSGFTVAAAASTAETATITVPLGGFGMSITAVDPGSTSIGVVLGGFTVSADALVTVEGADTVAIAVVLGGFGVSITAADPDSTSVDITMSSFGVSMTASTDEPNSIDIVIGGFQVAAAATVSGDAVLPRTLSEIVPSILNSLVGARVWQLATPDNLPRSSGGNILPFILWHRVGGMDSEYIDQTMPSHRHARIQVQSCAPGAIVADILHEQVCQVLLASAYTVGVLGSPVGAYDADRKLHAPWQQFSIWFQP